MKACEHEYENANCTNCANGLPSSGYECAKTKGTLKEYVHNKAEEIHRLKYNEGYEQGYEQGRAEVVDEVIKALNGSMPLVENQDIICGFTCAIERIEQLKEQNNGR